MNSAWLTILGFGLIFAATTLGAALVFFFKKEISDKLNTVFLGFAAGIMIAASVWSLLIPSIEGSEAWGAWSFVPAVVGFIVGGLFLVLLDKVVPHFHVGTGQEEGPRTAISKSVKMFLAITIHNIPEGLAVGFAFGGAAAIGTTEAYLSALGLAIGIAIQNFPEGAIISMPLHSKGLSKSKACWYGILSGIVEPIAGLITILLASLVMPVLPYFLSFAAGAMIFVVIEELVPEMAEGEHSNLGTIMFMLGFTLMMVLDVALG